MADHKGGREHRSLRKVFVGGLSYNTTDETLKSYFSNYGELVDSIVMKFPDNKRSRGFGFVEYSTLEEVDKCQAARPHKIDNKTVETKRATPRDECSRPGLSHGQSVQKLFIGGIKEEIEEEDMREFFSQYGNITDIVRMKDKETGRKKGFGFVEFDDYDPVDKIVLTGPHSIKGYKIDVKKAMPKEESRRMKAEQSGGWGGGDGFRGGYGNDGGYGSGGGFGGGGGYGSGSGGFGGGSGGFGGGSGGFGGGSGGYGGGQGGFGGFGGGGMGAGWGSGGDQGGWGGGYGSGGGPMRNGGGGGSMGGGMGGGGRGGRGGPYQGGGGGRGRGRGRGGR